jgi:hypothetical protein
MENSLQLPAHLDIAVVAPFPSRQRIQEGWMSRIAAIDKILEPFSRLYLNFAPHHLHGRDDGLVQHTENSWELCISSEDPIHRSFVSGLVDLVNGVYVHTCHLAENIESFLPSGKFVVDMHGIVPEEEVMLGRPERSPKYTRIEKAVLMHCSHVVVVTKAMERHFKEKYPTINPNFHVLPIIENYAQSNRLISISSNELPVSVMYAGGRQVWQNIDAMLTLACDSKDRASFSFLSHEHAQIKARAQELNLEFSADYGFCSKSDLPNVYPKYDFGLVLREDTAVNRVSCPTKLCEYLDFGLIPIVRTPLLGDYKELDYAYITEAEFRDGFIPDRVSRNWMIDQNREVISKLRQHFTVSVPIIREWFK